MVKPPAVVKLSFNGQTLKRSIASRPCAVLRGPAAVGGWPAGTQPQGPHPPGVAALFGARDRSGRVKAPAPGGGAPSLGGLHLLGLPFSPAAQPQALAARQLIGAGTTPARFPAPSPPAAAPLATATAAAAAAAAVAAPHPPPHPATPPAPSPEPRGHGGATTATAPPAPSFSDAGKPPASSSSSSSSSSSAPPLPAPGSPPPASGSGGTGGERRLIAQLLRQFKQTAEVRQYLKYYGRCVHDPFPRGALLREPSDPPCCGA